MSDRELLELAAKAAGIGGGCAWPDGFRKADKTIWNPLTDDGDALRLAVKLLINIDPYNGDPYAAARRAIVRAAAEIGKELK